MKKKLCAVIAVIAFLMVLATPVDYTGLFRWFLWELFWVPVCLLSVVEWEIENERQS